MKHAFAYSAAVVITGAIIFGGCTLNPSPFKPQTPSSPTPTPTSITTFPPPESFPTTTTISSASAVPVATVSATPTTKSGTVKGATTTKTTTTTTKPNPLFDTSFDSWTIINYPGQSYEQELIIYNKSDKPVMYAARAADRFSNTVPVSVNGSFEATGNMFPLSQEVIKLKAYSHDQTTGFTTTITINFIDQNHHILATRTVKVTAYTAVGDRSVINANDTHQNFTVPYRSLAAYPLRISNNNLRDLHFTAKIVNPEAAAVMAISAKTGTIKSGQWWDTDVHFLNPNTKVDRVTIDFTFTPTGSDDPYRSVNTVTLNIN